MHLDFEDSFRHTATLRGPCILADCSCKTGQGRHESERALPIRRLVGQNSGQGNPHPPQAFP